MQKTVHIQFDKKSKYLGKVDPTKDIKDGHFNIEVSHDEHEDVEKNKDEADFVAKFLGGKSKIDNEKRLEGLVKEELEHESLVLDETSVPTEQSLLELSKETLKSYMRANVEDRILRASGASFKSGKAGDEYNKADDTETDEKRKKGMDKAMDKLTKEDLDESLKDKNKIYHGVFARDSNGNYSHDSTHNLRADAQDAVNSHESKGAFHIPLTQDEAHSLNNADHTRINALLQSKRKSGIRGTFKMNESFGANILASIINNKPIEAQEQFGAAMSSILKTRIDNMRQDVASRIYNNEMNESVLNESVKSQMPGKIIDASTSPLYKERQSADIVKHSPEEMEHALKNDTRSVEVMGKGIQHKSGDYVGARLNLNVFKYTGIPVLTLHHGTEQQHEKGTGFFGGEAEAYKHTITLKNAKFNVNQTAREKIATGKTNKTVMASVDGQYHDTKDHSFNGVEAKFNPKREHVFVDEQGRAVKSAEEVTLHGHKVYMRGKIEYHTNNTMPTRKGDAPSAVTLHEINIHPVSLNEQYGVYHQRPEDIKTAKEDPTKPSTLYHLSTHSTKNSAQKEVDNLRNRGYTGFLYANKISDAEKMPHKIVKDFK